MTPERCGGDLKINAEEGERSIEVSNISITERTACAWELNHRTNGFLRFGGEVIDIKIDELLNMDIVIGKGGRLSKLEMNLTNQNLTLNTWYRMEGTETAFIAAVPRSAQNRIKYTYALRETLAPSRTYKLQLVANNIQLGITMIGLFIFFVSLLSIYLHRRYKHYKKIRDRDSQDEDEDSVNITP